MRKSVASSKARPINCKPTGKATPRGSHRGGGEGGGGAADQLQTDGQAIARESAGDGNRGESREIGRPAMSDNSGTRPDFFSIDSNGFGADGRRGDRKSRRHDGIHILEGRVKFREQALSYIKP